MMVCFDEYIYLRRCLISYNVQMNNMLFPWSHQHAPSSLQMFLPLKGPQVHLLPNHHVPPKITRQARQEKTTACLAVKQGWLVILHPSGGAIFDAVQLSPQIECEFIKQPTPDKEDGFPFKRLIKLSKKDFQGGFVVFQSHSSLSSESWTVFCQHLQSQYITLVGFPGQFKPTRKLGHGATATVFEGISTFTGDTVAIKAFKKLTYFRMQSGKGERAFQKEWSILSDCSHEGICGFRGTFQTQHSIYMILDKYDCQLGSLLNGEDLPVLTVLNIMEDLLQGLSYLHGAGIMHRDIKLENIMVQRNKFDYKPVLIDFGMAEYIHSQSYLFPKCGTPGYVAPEVFAGVRGERPQKCDIFSLGVVFHILLFKKHVFEGKDAREAALNNKRGKMSLDMQALSSKGKQVADLLQRMLQVDPQKRISADQALKHEVFKPILSPALTSVSCGKVAEESYLNRIDFEDRQQQQQQADFLQK